MPIIQLIVLALIQGITEFLPISSSAHLILAPLAVDSWADQGPLIDVAAHVGSLFAVLLYFKNETAMLFRGGVDTLCLRASPDRKLFLYVAAATIPIITAAAFVVSFDLLDALRSPVIIGWASIIFGLLLWHGDRAPAVKDGLDRIGWREVITIGAAQALAIIPGASRSGVTMTAARYLGWTRPEAARFSMLLAIPTISAFGLFAGLELASEGSTTSLAAAGIVAALSFLSAYGAILLFMKLTQRISFTPFVIYRLLLGVALLYFAGNLI
ncbi:MAG: undecaprenyl-diphosphatase [Hyphococcus sp.]|nr:MAG: undecaprenyl-diphosphatase [Marinicaulis sp.]